jgi:hypothetical protein
MGLNQCLLNICFLRLNQHLVVGFTAGRFDRRPRGRLGQTYKDLVVIYFTFRVVFVS